MGSGKSWGGLLEFIFLLKELIIHLNQYFVHPHGIGFDLGSKSDVHSSF